MCAEPLESGKQQIISECARGGAGDEGRKALQKTFCAHFESLWIRPIEKILSVYFLRVGISLYEMEVWSLFFAFGFFGSDIAVISTLQLSVLNGKLQVWLKRCIMLKISKFIWTV